MGADRTLVVVLVVVAGLGWVSAAVLAGLLVVSVLTRPDVPAEAGAPDDVPGVPEVALEVDPRHLEVHEGAYVLTVHEDGCGVVRSEGPDGGDLRALTWVVTDTDGFQVLGRAAEGETRYRYYRPGTYDVVLESFGRSSYEPVSNRVRITC